MPTIVIDLDRTLCNCTDRLHWAQESNWLMFHSLLIKDEPYKDVVTFLRALPSRWEVIAVTGRNAEFYNLTQKWLTKHGLHNIIDWVIMRPDGDWRPDHEIKIEMLEKHIGSKKQVLEQVLFVLDDRDKVVSAWREYGLPCWQVRPGAY